MLKEKITRLSPLHAWKILGLNQLLGDESEMKSLDSDDSEMNMQD